MVKLIYPKSVLLLTVNSEGRNIVQNILSNKIVQYLLVIAVVIVLQGLSFMASVSASIASSVTTLATMITLVAIVWIFSSGLLGGRK